MTVLKDLKIPFKTLNSTYFYLKHAQIPQKCILKQVLSEGSTAQNGQKVVKIAKIHYFTIGASRGQVRQVRFAGPRKIAKSRLKLSNRSISTSNMHKYPRNTSQNKFYLREGSAQNGQKVLFAAKIHYLTIGLSRPSPIYRASHWSHVKNFEIRILIDRFESFKRDFAILRGPVCFQVFPSVLEA